MERKRKRTFSGADLLPKVFVYAVETFLPPHVPTDNRNVGIFLKSPCWSIAHVSLEECEVVINDNMTSFLCPISFEFKRAKMIAIVGCNDTPNKAFTKSNIIFTDRYILNFCNF